MCVFFQQYKLRSLRKLPYFQHSLFELGGILRRQLGVFVALFHSHDAIRTRRCIIDNVIQRRGAVIEFIRIGDSFYALLDIFQQSGVFRIKRPCDTLRTAFPDVRHFTFNG